MDPITISTGIAITKEVAKVLMPFALDVIELVKRNGELTPEEKARLEALNAKTEGDYVREAGGRP